MNFSLDAFPINKSILENNDYNGQMLFSSISDPLFRFNGNTIVPYACKQYYVSKDGKKHSFILRDDLFFSDGKKVTATDYLNSINYLLHSETPLALLLSNISSLSADKLSLKINLKRSDFQFYKILSRINFTPCRKRKTSGLYEIQSYKNDKIRLIPNTFNRNFRKDLHNLTFLLITDSKTELRLFEKNKLDFTSNTSFRHTYLEKYINKIQKYPNFITMSLTFINKNLLHPKYLKLRRTILSSINRTKIADLFNNMFSPTDNYFIDSNKNDLHIPKKNNLNQNITIGYDDFYPNKEILDIIKQQLAECGINITLIKDDFYKPKYNYDIKLSLSFPDYIDNSAFYRSAYFNALINFAGKNNLYFKILQNKLYKPKTSMSALKLLNKLLLKHALIIPLFSMNSIYLSNCRLFSFQKLNFESI